MKQIIRIFACFAFAFFTLSASAQQFRVDPLFEETASANIVKSQEGLPSRFEMPRDTVIMAKSFDQKRATFDHNGAEYTVLMKHLVWGDDNPDDMESPFGTNHKLQHSLFGDVMGAEFTLMVIMAIIIGATLLCYAGQKSEKRRREALRIVPGALIIAAMLEATIALLFGEDAFNVFTPVTGILFIPTAAAQYFSFRLYCKLLFNGETEVGGGPRLLSIKPVLIRFATFIPIIVVAAIIFSMMGLPSVVADILTLAVGLGTVAFGIRKTYRQNLEVLEPEMAFNATLFTVTYLIGMTITAILTFMIALALILPLLSGLVTVVLLYFILTFFDMKRVERRR